MTTHELLFTIGNIAILPFWALMILAPRWNVTQRIMQTLWPFVVLALLYTAAIIASLFTGGVDMTRVTLDLNGLVYLLGNPAGTATAWLHMLALDLFAGHWAYLDSRKRNYPAWVVSPVLFFILMMGPFGLLLYLVARWWLTRKSRG